MQARTRNKLFLDKDNIIPKGEVGRIIAFQWDDTGYYVLVNFPKAQQVKCSTDSVEVSF